MDPDKVKMAFQDVMGANRIPELGTADYKTARDRFEFVVTRDTLIQLDIPFVMAERLAQTHTGPARARLTSCLEHLK